MPSILANNVFTPLAIKGYPSIHRRRAFLWYLDKSFNYNYTRTQTHRLRYFRTVNTGTPPEIEDLPLHSRTPLEWGRAALAEPVNLLIDHAFLEKKAATNALELLTRWPGDWLDGWMEAMTGIARDEVTHLSQVMRILLNKGARMDRYHKNPYANSLRQLVRKGDKAELLDRLLIAALIEVRSCERFSVLAAVAADNELAGFYHSLYTSELGHYRIFLRLAGKFTDPAVLEARWQQMLVSEALILGEQEPGPRIHSGWRYEEI